VASSAVVLNDFIWTLFLPTRANLSRTRRFLNTWKTGFAVKASQCSSHLYWVKPWIHTFLSNCSGTQCWLTTPEYLFGCGRCSIKDQKVPQHVENRFSGQVNVPAIYTEANHEYKLSDLTVVVHSADRQHLNTFLHAEDALSRTRKFLNTWKTGFAIKAGQCSSHLYRSKPWIQTFWSNCSITHCWLTTPEHLSACGRCSTKDQKTSQHLEKMVSQWWQFNFLAMLLDHTINTHFLSPGHWHTVLTGSTRILVYPRNMLYRGPQDSSKPGKPVLAWTLVGILAICSGSSHDYTHFS